MNLIIVDDEKDVQFLFQQKFRKEIKSGNVNLKFALNGHSALKLIKSLENYSDYFVLTDINMPEMSGTQLLKEIKINYPTLKVIMISAYGDEENVKNAKQNGAEDYFTKPLEFDLLKEKLKYLYEN